jgi:hypothetical protein
MSIECSTDVSAEENAFGHFGSFLHPMGVKGMDQQKSVCFDVILLLRQTRNSRNISCSFSVTVGS